jgi:DNA-binding beta-propeller fold protein YncE
MPKSELGHPEGIVVLKDGRIAVTDTHYSRIVIFKPNGEVDKIFGKKGTKRGELGNPVGIAEDPQENLYVCEYGFSDRVQKFDKNGNILLEIGRAGIKPDEFQRPSGIVYNKKKLYIADAVNNRVQIFTNQGKHVKTITASPAFYLPYDIKLGKDGYLYVVEYGNNCITKLTIDGTVIGRFGKNSKDKLQLKSPWGVAVDSTGTVYIADTGSRRVMVLKK